MRGGKGLLEEGAALVAALEAYVKRSEDRLAYRKERGRELSKQHRQQLEGVLAAVDALRGRLKAILEPLPDAEELLARFQDLRGRVAGLAEGGNDG